MRTLDTEKYPELKEDEAQGLSRNLEFLYGAYLNLDKSQQRNAGVYIYTNGTAALHLHSEEGEPIVENRILAVVTADNIKALVKIPDLGWSAYIANTCKALNLIDWRGVSREKAMEILSRNKFWGEPGDDY